MAQVTDLVPLLSTGEFRENDVTSGEYKSNPTNHRKQYYPCSTSLSITPISFIRKGVGPFQSMSDIDWYPLNIIRKMARKCDVIFSLITFLYVDQE